MQWPQTHSQTHVMCQPSTAGPTGGLPSLFAGDTPPVYTAPANAILVVGPCLWVLLMCLRKQTRHTQSSFPVVMHSSSKCLQPVFARVEVGGVSPCVGMCVHVSVYLSCFCLCVVFVCIYVLKSLIHACACGGPSADSMWRPRGRRERSECATVVVVSDCRWPLCVIAGCVMCQ